MPRDLSPDQTAHIVAAVRAIIDRQGTKGRAAAALCLHERTLDNLVTGSFVPGEAVLERIAAARGTSVDALLAGS